MRLARRTAAQGFSIVLMSKCIRPGPGAVNSLRGRGVGPNAAQLVFRFLLRRLKGATARFLSLTGDRRRFPKKEKPGSVRSPVLESRRGGPATSTRGEQTARRLIWEDTAGEQLMVIMRRCAAGTIGVAACLPCRIANPAVKYRGSLPFMSDQKFQRCALATRKSRNT